MWAGLRRKAGGAVLVGALLASGTVTGQVPEGSTLAGEEEHADQNEPSTERPRRRRVA